MRIHHEIIEPNYTIRYLEKFTGGVAHWHQRMELVLVDRGSFRVTVQDKVYEGRPGDIFAIRSGVIHWIQSTEPGSAMYVCTFSVALLYQLQAQVPFVQCHMPKGALEQAGIGAELCRYFSEMYREKKLEEQYAQLSIPARIELIYALLARHFKAKTQENSMERFWDFQAVLSYISENFREPISLGDIAGKLNYSTSYVSTMFVAYTGLNFKTYLDSIRIHEATKLLLGGNDSVSHICACCGFENIRTFNNVFRRVTGTTPSRFRKSK